MPQTRATATFKRQKWRRLELQPLFKDRNAPDSSHSHFSKTGMRRIRGTVTVKDRIARDLSHSHFEKTEMPQTEATATLHRQNCVGLEPQSLCKDRIAPELSHSHSAKTVSSNSPPADPYFTEDDQSTAVQKIMIHMWGSPLRIIHLFSFVLGSRQANLIKLGKEILA